MVLRRLIKAGRYGIRAAVVRPDARLIRYELNKKCSNYFYVDII